ncbi:MAG: hypothetical protein GY906_24620 [bacterium]|nr:hypothetical protein [bacterium]
MKEAKISPTQVVRVVQMLLEPVKIENQHLTKRLNALEADIIILSNRLGRVD